MAHRVYTASIVTALAAFLMFASSDRAGAPAEVGYLARIREAADLLQRDVPRQAADEFAAASAQDYADPLAWIGLGAALLAQGQVDSALGQFEQAVEIGTEGSEQAGAAGQLARLGRAVCLLQRGQVARAREELRELAQDESARALPALAYAELAAGERDAAQAHAQAALERYPDDPLALAVLGRLSPGRDGIPLLIRALELCPGSRYAAPLTALALPNTPRAENHAEQANVRLEIVEGPPRRAVVTWLGPEDRVYITVRFDGQDLGISNAPPHEFGLPRELGPGFHGLVAEALSDGAVVARASLLLRGEAGGAAANRYDAAEYEAALAGLRSAMVPIPNRVHLHYWQGVASAAAGQRERAVASYERVVALDPTFADARQRLVALVLALGRKGSTREISTVPGKRICLTFDDGPNPIYTERILKLLRAANVRATFFVVGTQARAHPDLLRAIAAAGHEIANHSYSHDDMTRKSAAEVQQELLATQVAVEDATGRRTRLFRPPGGRRTADLRAAAAHVGYTTVVWSASVGVCAGLSPEKGVRRLLQDIKPGAVVLLHNGPDETPQVLPGLLDALKKRRYSFSTLSEALGK